MILDLNPDCDKPCRFTTSNMYTTAAYFEPIYDKTGQNLNPDGNVSTFNVTCTACGKSWKASMQYDKVTFGEVK